MTSVVVLDTNLLVLLAVGSASRTYISRHNRLEGYSETDFDLLVEIAGMFSDIVVIPHIWTETDYLVRSGGLRPPATQQVLDKLRTLIISTNEAPASSAHGALREEFAALGLADSMLLHLCSLQEYGIEPTLLTADEKLADAASAQGYQVIDYKREFRQI